MLDVILVAILLLSAVWGFARGMILVVFSLVGFVAALLAARLFAPALTGWLLRTSDWKDSLRAIIGRNLESIGGEGAAGAAENLTMAQMETMPEYADITALGFRQLPATLAQGLDLSLAADTITYYMLLAISAVLIFLVVKAVFSLAGLVLRSLVRQSQILGGTDRIIGLLLGCVIGVILVSLAVSVLVPLGATIGHTGLLEALRTSRVVALLVQSGGYGLFLSVLL